MCRRRDACRVPSLNWVLIIGLVFCCPFQWGFLYNLEANKFEPCLELSSGAGGKGLKSNFERARTSALQRAEGAGGGERCAWVNTKESMTAYIPFFSSTHVTRSLISRLGYHHWQQPAPAGAHQIWWAPAIGQELNHSLSPPRFAFLAWGDFQARSRFARSQPRPQGFSLKKWVGRPTHFSREKPWGRGWLALLSLRENGDYS